VARGRIAGAISEQRLAVGGGNTRAPARRPGGHTGLERRLDGDGDELRGLRVDDDVPAEQNAADDLPGVRERVVRADGGGLGHTRDCRRNGPGPVAGHAGFATPLRRSPGGALPVRGAAGDRVANRLRIRGRAADASGAPGAASSRSPQRRAGRCSCRSAHGCPRELCLVNLLSAQLTGIVSGQDLTHHATCDQGHPSH